MPLLVLALPAMLESGCVHAKSEPALTGPAELWGYVVKVDKGDTVRVSQAKVWTNPPSIAVMTDSAGYWRINDGLVPGDYRVLAEIEGGIKGQTTKVPVELGKWLRVVVILGAEESAWPPAVAYDHVNFKPTVGPGGAQGVRGGASP